MSADLTARPLKAVMLERLMDSGVWMTRTALARGASTSPAAIDDALADLVIEKRAEYREAVGYRLAGTEMTRAAAKKMRAEGLARAVFGRQEKDEFRVGVAEHREALGLVMYELAMPMPPAGPGFLDGLQRQVDGIVDFSINRGF